MVFQIVAETAVLNLPDACVDDVSAPSFAGIDSFVAEDSGGFFTDWLSAASGVAPYTYDLHLGHGSLTYVELLALDPVLSIKDDLKTRVFTLTDKETYFVKGETYSAMMKAVGQNGIKDTNTVVKTAVALANGNLAVLLQDLYNNYYNTQQDLQNSATSIADSAQVIDAAASSIADTVQQISMKQSYQFEAEVDVINVEAHIDDIETSN